MTTNNIYGLEQQAYRQFCARFHQILRSAFPETDGREQFVHNWYRCQEDSAEYPCADALLSAQWDWWHKIQDRIDRWREQAEHRAHSAHGFDCLWCPICKSQKRAS